MSEYVLLVPKTENSPAKVKDPGVINLVKSGAAAYNAKSGTLLFLPEGEKLHRAIASSLRDSLFSRCGFQPVDCGSDDALQSVAERFVREFGDAATRFSEKRGRDLRVLSWQTGEASAEDRAAETMRTILETLNEKRSGVFSFVEETTAFGEKTFTLASKSEPGALGARPGFVCDACGEIKFPDSPLGFVPPQPGEDEPEEALEDIETPGANTIAELCSQLDIEVPRTLKAMLYVAEDAEGQRRAVASFVRGDYNLSMNKLANWAKAERNLTGLRSAEKSELHELVGEVAGYCGPVGMPPHVIVVCDFSVVGSKNAVAGANRPGYHKKGCCHPRDFDPPVADIAQLTEATPCRCGGKYEQRQIRESGSLEIFTGARPSTEIKALSYRDRDGAHDFPAIVSGIISLERVMLAMNSEI